MGKDIFNTYFQRRTHTKIYFYKKIADNPIQKWVRDVNKCFIRREYLDIQKHENGLKLISNLGSPN